MLIALALAATQPVMVRPVAISGAGRLTCAQAFEPAAASDASAWVTGFFAGRNMGAGRGSSSTVGASMRMTATIDEVRRLCAVQPTLTLAGAAERVYRNLATGKK